MEPKEVSGSENNNKLQVFNKMVFFYDKHKCVSFKNVDVQVYPVTKEKLRDLVTINPT